jgi:NADH-quinone oxidoreductase subunit J
VMMLGFGAAVVLNRNPIASALSLVMCFMGLSALFISLDAFFIGIIQVLVYAGAVMVLFLFIIMLLDLRTEARRKMNVFAVVGGSVVTITFFIQICLVIGRFSAAKKPFPSIVQSQDDTFMVGAVLFTDYTLPFQIIGVLVLVATIGVIVLSKRELR